jgi:lysozyme
MYLKTSTIGLALIKKYESFRSKPYLCPAGKPTIGYGSTKYPDNSPVKLTDTAITEVRANQILMATLTEYEENLHDNVRVRLEQHHFDALVCFSYNVGVGSLNNSTLLKMVNKGDFTGAYKQFARWNKAWIDGKLVVLSGLTTRRREEAELFFPKNSTSPYR